MAASGDWFILSATLLESDWFSCRWWWLGVILFRNTYCHMIQLRLNSFTCLFLYICVEGCYRNAYTNLQHNVNNLKDSQNNKCSPPPPQPPLVSKIIWTLWRTHNLWHVCRREHWDKFSTFNCWSQLLEITRKQSHDHGILAEICGQHVYNRLAEIQDNSQRLFRRVGVRCSYTVEFAYKELLGTMKICFW